MKDNEVIKALEYCTQQGITSECERCKVKKGCRSELIVNALDLISRQQAEIERLEGLAKHHQFLINELNIGIAEHKAEVVKEVWKKLRCMCDPPNWCVWLSDIDVFFETLTGEKLTEEEFYEGIKGGEKNDKY